MTNYGDLLWICVTQESQPKKTLVTLSGHTNDDSAFFSLPFSCCVAPHQAIKALIGSKLESVSDA